MRFWSVIGMFMFFGASGLQAQIDVSLAWEQDTIELGDEVQLRLSLMNRGSVEIQAVSKSFLDSLISGFQTARLRDGDTSKVNEFAYADTEILDFGGFSDDDEDNVFTLSEMKWERSRLNSEELMTNVFKMRVWDPGQIVALTPDVAFSINDVLYPYREKRQASLFVRPPVDVSALEQDSLNIAPIKAIIKEPVKLSDYLIYAYILAGIASLALAYYLYIQYERKKAAVPVEIPEVFVPAHKIALSKLYELDEMKLWQSGKIKVYQSKLTDIVREYLENRYEIPALESTTDEILYDLKKKNLSNELINELRNILQVADLVKFAKSKPEVNIHQEFMNKSLEFVQSTKKPVELEEV